MQGARATSLEVPLLAPSAFGSLIPATEAPTGPSGVSGLERPWRYAA